MDSSYCYKDSDVLINHLNIHSEEKLKNAERKLTMLRIADLIRRPITGQFDVKHLCRIHEYIFQDLYSWAGKFRTVEIAKGTYFCKTDYIPQILTQLCDKLKSENYLNNCSREQLIIRLAWYLSELNAIHPFREGNGRAQREFIRELALKNDAILHYDAITPAEMITASIESFNGDYTKMEELIRKCISF